MFTLTKGHKITCYCKEDMLFALDLLEEAGFTWINGGEKPTVWIPHEQVEHYSWPDTINFHSDDKGKLKICRGSYPSGKEVTVPVDDLFITLKSLED